MATPKPKKPAPAPVKSPIFPNWEPTAAADAAVQLAIDPAASNSISADSARRLFDTSQLFTDEAKATVVDRLPLFGTKADAVAVAADTPSPTASWLSAGLDGLKAAGAAIGAFQSLPTRKDNPELTRMQQVYKQNADQGLTAAERLNAERQMRNGFLRDQQAITQTAGGGGSAAAVLSASGAASLRADNVGLQIQEADHQARMQNQDRYWSILGQEDARNRADYGVGLNNAITGRDAFAKTMMANLQQIGDRATFDQAGYGAVLAELMKKNAAKERSLTATSILPNG